MTDGSDRARALREAVRIAPDDAGLRGMLAQALLDASDAAAAETEFRAALRLAPDDDALRVGLARAFHRQGKASQALVVLEDALASGGADAETHRLHVRVLLDAGELERARSAWREARSAYPALDDVELAARLGAAPEMRLPAASAPDVDGGDDDALELDAESPQTTFADVGGMEEVKDEVRRKILHPLQHPELYRAYGRSAGGGVLMYGPPGCGKTHLARAVAGEIGGAFLALGIHEILDMWIGQSERNLNDAFEQAREQAPCVLFFDEVDALGARRSEMRAGAGRSLINQFLAEMDGIDSANEGVLVLAATNAPWHLDPAFRRPGRFDRVLFVPPPDAAARAEILRILLRGRPVEGADLAKVARKTDGFSGADLKAVVETAAERKIEEAIRAGRTVPLGTRDLLRAAGDVRPTTGEWFATARNHVLYANESGLYDPVRPYL